MSNFENPALDLKKTIIITSSASALPISAGYLYAVIFLKTYNINKSIMVCHQRSQKVRDDFAKMGAKWGSSFVEMRMGTFGGGCFGNMAKMTRKVFLMMSRNREK